LDVPQKNLPANLKMKLYIVRHGQTEENLNGIIQGHKPGKLSALGIEQAKLLALRLKDHKFDAIYSSDLKRAVDTCWQVAQFHDVPVSYTPLLRERSSGIFEGRRREDLWEAEKLSGLPPVDFTPEAGENFRDLRRRADLFLSKLQALREQKTILIVSHGGWNRMLLGIAMNKSVEESLTITQKNTCVNIIEYDESLGFTVYLLNCAAHLDVHQ
jgi:broad specificity phosphatase PhoE